MRINIRCFATALAFTALAFTSVGCTQETETTFTDEGSACISGEPDAAQTVTVDFQTCLSSSCDTLLESSCTAELDGTELTITATATVSSKSGACTADCGLAQATCETPPLPAGSYDVVYGQEQGTLVVPAVTGGESTCIGEP
ncbi:hypothetical protein [Enhygromyxa salina]|uniref:Lipoprotein n=1 Tax=Enhygromyxa salina TaxID=215803 RepID=A0A2S9YKZ4_9BACT|nr:hypothetical protein [Enhygromyxa salina]PRQ05712.1 hypothetical protein ENSA7_43830 [Enhygromyxa salina]